jgi:hypothetical protein
MEDNGERKVKVTDKRKFDAEGNRISDEDQQEETSGKPPIVDPGDSTTSAGVGGGAANMEEAKSDITDQFDTEEIAFTQFVLSLATQAMVGMGLIPDPNTNKKIQHLPMAKQMIDIIEMLRKKTKGNLEAQEITTVDNILYDLRMNYVQVKKQEKQAKEENKS